MDIKLKQRRTSSVKIATVKTGIVSLSEKETLYERKGHHFNRRKKREG